MLEVPRFINPNRAINPRLLLSLIFVFSVHMKMWNSTFIV